MRKSTGKLLSSVWWPDLICLALAVRALYAIGHLVAYLLGAFRGQGH